MMHVAIEMTSIKGKQWVDPPLRERNGMSVANTWYTISLCIRNFQLLWFDRKWQRESHYSRFATISSIVSNQLVDIFSNPNHEEMRHQLYISFLYTFSFHPATSSGYLHQASPNLWEKRRVEHGMVGECSRYATRNPISDAYLAWYVMIGYSWNRCPILDS